MILYELQDEGETFYVYENEHDSSLEIGVESDGENIYARFSKEEELKLLKVLLKRNQNKE